MKFEVCEMSDIMEIGNSHGVSDNIEDARLDVKDAFIGAEEDEIFKINLCIVAGGCEPENIPKGIIDCYSNKHKLFSDAKSLDELKTRTLWVR